MTDKLRVDKHIPMPAPARSESKYPFGDMEIGDSFFAPKKLAYICNLAAAHRKKESHKGYSSRTVDGGTRCWRVK